MQETGDMQDRSTIMKAAIMAMAISLSACASIIDPVDDTVVDLSAEIPARANWAEPAPDALPKADWVEAFGDDGLTTMVASARADNPSVRRSLAQLDRAIAAKNSSRGSLYPTLGLSSSIRRSEGGTGFNSGTTSYDLGVGSSWEVDVVNRLHLKMALCGLV